ncbi:MAG: hypothetical protein HYW26_02845 [Candidatus Aenigmarchaeota archaeon]|nr:hypothetical protein [Candidatus Aenigmarchaeota archaeon]
MKQNLLLEIFGINIREVILMERKIFLKIFFLIALAVAALGCISFGGVTKLSSGTLVMKITADPPEVFIDGLSNVYVDVANKDVKTLESVSIDVFETGLMDRSGDCRQSVSEMKPNQSFTVKCMLRARTEITSSEVSNDVHARAKFSAVLSILQPVDFISSDWYERQRLLGLQLKPRKFAYADQNLQATVEFSDNMPFVVREGKKYYMYITVENVGGGIMSQIEPPKIEYVDKSARIARECVFEKLLIVGKKFPRIACEITPPETDTQKTVDLILNIGYNYDIRDSVVVKIKK